VGGVKGANFFRECDMKGPDFSFLGNLIDGVGYGAINLFILKTNGVSDKC
jgi:hypothetical protein